MVNDKWLFIIFNDHMGWLAYYGGAVIFKEPVYALLLFLCFN